MKDTQTHNADLISRSEMQKRISNMTGMFTDGLGFVLSADAISWTIESAPSVDAAPVRHGRWELVFRRNVFGEHYVEWHACSICKELALSRRENYMDDEELSNYCPNCGAKMIDGDK